MERNFSDVRLFFKKYLIDTKTKVENLHSLFVNVQKLYNKSLRSSIKSLIESGALKRRRNPLNYTYLILDGTLLDQLLDIYEKNNNLIDNNIRNADFDRFMELIFYIGKGVNNRKLSHLMDGRKICLKQLDLKKVSAKFSKIAQIWEKGHGISVIQLFSESSHYEAMSREYAMIRAIKLNNLTNVNNSKPFGVMCDKWTTNEIVNFGTMSIYNAFAMAIKERPTVIYQEDVPIFEGTKGKGNYSGLGGFELQGILECFLELGL